MVYKYIKYVYYVTYYHSLLHGLISSIIVHATSTNSLSFALSSCNTYLIKSVILTSSSLSSSLKTFIISKFSIKDTVLPSLFAFICAKWLIIPLQRLFPQAHYRALVFASILSQDIVIGPCSRCADKGLVYIAIAAPSSCQPSFYFKCTSLNIQSSCNVHLVLVVEYTPHIFLYLRSSHSSSRNT